MNQPIAANLWGTSPEQRVGARRISSPPEGAHGPRMGMPSPGGGTWQHPGEARLNDRPNQAAMEIGEIEKDAKASIQQQNMTAEFLQFCNHECPCDLSRCTLNQDKVTRFMMCQAMREAKPRGGAVESRALAKQGICFDHTDCQTVIDAIDEAPMCNLTGRKIHPQPTRPCGWPSFNGCKAIIKKTHRAQESRNDNGRSWGSIWTVNLDELQKMVKERKGRVSKMNCEEKVNDEFASCEVVERCEDTEQSLWNDSHTTGLRSIITALRHRYCLMHLTSGVLRAESLHRADTSDFRSFEVPKLSTDTHNMPVLVNQTPHGKTTHGDTQCGRATRHENVILCCWGALAFYLMMRVHVTQEFANLTSENWMDNKCWFDIKPLVDVNGSNRTQEMKNDSHGERIKNALKRLGIMCSKLLHLGRNVGAKILDLLQEEESSIDAMGQWAQSLRQRCHSSKLPMSPIRKLAGHEDSKHYYNPRSQVKPSQELREMTPIGKWCYKACADLLNIAEPGKHKTAFSALKFFCDLNDVFLQDSAAIMVLCPKTRALHPMFDHIPVFATPEFKAFKDKMKLELEAKSELPHSANIENCLPGLQAWQNVNFRSVGVVNGKVDAPNGKVDKLVDHSESGTFTTNVTNTAKRELAASLLCAARDLLLESADTNTTFGSPSTNLLKPHSQTPTTAATEQLTPPANDSTMSPPPDSPTDPLTASPTSPTAVLNLNSPSDPSRTTECPRTTGEVTAADHQGFRMVLNHPTLLDLHNEWCGKDKFEDQHGGISGRDKLCGAQWRKHNKHVRAHVHSRSRRSVEAIECFAKQNKVSPEQACIALQPAHEASSEIISKFVKHCQQHGLMKKQQPRGKKATKQQQQPTQ